MMMIPPFLTTTDPAVACTTYYPLKADLESRAHYYYYLPGVCRSVINVPLNILFVIWMDSRNEFPLPPPTTPYYSKAKS